MTKDKLLIQNVVQAIQPCDDLENEHKEDVLKWILSGAPLYRIAKPDNPPKHLVSYFVVVDISHKSLMLVDHLKAKLLLPTGGHVEIGEDPAETVVREAREELNIDAGFLPLTQSKPFFITVETTKGAGMHTDVSLWYIIEGSIDEKYAFDEREFSSYKWFSFSEVLNMDIQKLDPHMHRFTKKLVGQL